MKSLFKHLIQFLLGFKAHRFIKKNRIQVIAITGSVGKTSAKEAIYTVLKDRFYVIRSQKSFNTPIGMSLAILGESESGFSSTKAWAKILWRVFFKKKELPQKMILEMGAEKPGDIKELIKIAPPHISIVTTVKPVHLGEGQFKDIEDIAKEKGKLVNDLPRFGLAILNHDDPRVEQMKTAAKKMTYGLDINADLQASEIKMTAQKISFDVRHKGETASCEVPVVGAYHVYVALPAIAVGLSMGMSLRESCKALSQFQLPPGRMNPIAGLNGSHILDGSYNASPSTMQTALQMLSQLKASRKMAALGTMNELGKESFQAHVDLGKTAAPVADLIVAVGPEAKRIKQGAIVAGMKAESIFIFDDAKEAGQFLAKKIQKDDLILVKGSQNKVRMERLVKEIMKEPRLAKKLLCRQEDAWAHKQ